MITKKVIKGFAMTLAMATMLCFAGCAKEEIEVTSEQAEYIDKAREVKSLSYVENSDGTYTYYGQNYKYKLELSGTPKDADREYSFVLLSNKKSVTLDQAYKSIYGKEPSDWFDDKETIIVEMK